MTMPIWMALPPEVNSAALSTGPGPGSLLATAAAWESLSAEYDAAAAELSALLAAVQAGTWQGPSAEAYVAAHVPYLAWLFQNSVNSSAAAREPETVAAAYMATLAAMPTLEEIAANRATLATLMATNFFGINTIPIELTEIDYLRMWLQAATVMAMYEAVSETALTWKPPTAPPPPIQNANSANQDEGPGPTTLSWWVTRVEEVDTALHTDLAQFPSNPSGAITKLLTDPVLVTEVPHWAGESLTTFISQVPQLTQISYALIAPSIPLACAGGLAGLAGLASVSQPVPASIPATTPGPSPSDIRAPAALASAPATPTPAATAAPVPAPTPTSVPAPTAPPATPTAIGVQGFGYPYVVGPPGIGAGGEMSTRARTKEKAPEPDSVAPAATAAPRERERRRGRARRGRTDRGHRYEYLDQDSEAEPAGGDEQVASTANSDQGAGTMGLAGTAFNASAGRAAGLTTLVGDSMGGGPALPMLPSSWAPETEDPES